MRKIKPSLWAALALALFVVLTGCAGITIEMGGDEAGALIEVTARRLAYHTALEKPGIIEPGLLMCAEFETAMDGGDMVDVEALLYRVIGYAKSEWVQDDPLLAYDIETLASLVHIDVSQPLGDLDEDQMKYIKKGVAAFRMGLMLAKEKLDGPEEL